MVKVEVGFAIDIGKNPNKQNQEDFILFELIGPSRGIFILNDGIGGENSGEIASAMASYSIMNDLFGGLALDDDLEFEIIESEIKSALNNAHVKIFEKAKNQYKGMGTTNTVLFLDSNRVFWPWCGDSRIYRLSEDGFETLTRDHDQFEIAKEAGLYEEKDKFTTLRGTLGQFALIQGLGDPDLEDSEKPKKLNLVVKGEELEAGKFLYIFCSDGLHNVLPDSRILEICWPYIESEEDKKFSAQQVADALIQEALRLETRDNISVLCLGIEIEEEEGEEDDQDKTQRKTLEVLK